MFKPIMAATKRPALAGLLGQGFGLTACPSGMRRRSLGGCRPRVQTETDIHNNEAERDC
jgi:hypothetical protein